MVVDPVIGGTTVPAVGSYIYTPGEVVPISATPMQGYRFIYWLGGVDEPDSSSTTVTMNENKNIIAKFIRLGDVRVTTNPEGLRIIVDNDAYISPQDFHWTPGTVHTISIDSTMQYRGSGTRYLYKRWSDDGASTHQITVNEEYIYTAEFQTQYKLTTADAPVNGGTMTPAPPGEWYDVDVHVEVKANPDTLNRYRFTGWTGDLNGNANPDSVLMDGPKNVTANYSRTLNVLITTEPDSLSIYIDEKKYTSPYEFTWEEGSTHTLAADTLKSDGAGKRFVFNTWSDSKPRQHTVTVMSDTVFTAKYIRQYYLSTFVDPVDGGVIIPAAPGVWFEKNSKVELSAIPNSEKDYVFSEWRGALSGSANPDTLTMDAPKSVTAHFRSSDMEAPKLTYLYPANGSHHVPRNEFIQFKVKDAESGINLSTFHFSVNDEIIIKNGVDLTGGFAAVNYSGKNCTVIYDPAEDFKADSTITLNIQCEDLSTAKNKMTSTTSFSIGFSILTYTKKDTLDQRGGAVFDDSTGIVVFVPDSALIDTTIITIGFVSSYPELPEDKRGFPIGIHLGPSGIQFTDSVTITLPYNQALLDSAGVSHPKDFKVYLYSALKGEWTTLKVINADNQNIYVKVLEFCYLVYGKKYTTVSKPNKPVGPTDLHINTQYEFKTSKVLSVLGHPVEYRFDWGDGLKSAWLQDTTSTHIWTIAGEYGIIAMARSRVDTTHLNISDTLHVSVSDVSAIENGNAVPTTFKLSQNYPNPFNPETTIKYQIPQNVYVTMEIYNINGQKIRTLVNEEKSSGYYTIIWDGKNDYNMAVSTGLYFMKMKAGDYVRVIKMSYLK